MSKLKYIAILLVLILAAQPAMAGDDFEVKNIAVVDLKKILDESKAAKTAQKEIADIKTKYMNEIKAEDKKLVDSRKSILNQRKALSEAAFNKRVAEFEKKIREERTKAAKKQKVIEEAFVKSLQLIKDETVKIVNDIAKEKELDLVIPTAQVLYTKPGIDITADVLNRLDRRLTKVNINIKD